MAKQERTGKRKERQEKHVKKYELGYYLIVTDTEETENNYFTGLKRSLLDSVRNRIVVKVIETETDDLIARCIKEHAYDPQYRIPWIVFDRDKVGDFDQIIEEAEKNEIKVGWSNPCFEIWLSAYFGSMPIQESSVKCCKNFGRLFEQRTGQEYSKADKQIYEKLNSKGDEFKAIKMAENRLCHQERSGKSKPSEMLSCTTVHVLVQEIKGIEKAKNQAKNT